MRKKRRVIATLLIATLLLSDVQMVALAEDVITPENETLDIISEEAIQENEVEGEVTESEETEEENQENGEIESKVEDGTEDAKIEKESSEQNNGEIEKETSIENIETQVQMVERDTQNDFQYTAGSDTDVIVITGYIGNESLVTIPSTIDGKRVEGIGDYAFRGCTGITEVKFPNKLKILGNNAFEGCIGIKKIELPEGLEKISGEAFSGCTAITEIKLPTKVKQVGYRAFENCGELGKITLNEGLESIGSGFLSKTAVKEIIIPKTVTGMSSALSGAESLTKVTFESGMERIPSSALSDTGSTVKEVSIPETVMAIGSFAFYGCTGLTEIKLPGKLKEIEGIAFKGCKGISEIELPGSLEKIGNEAFSGCTAITEIILPIKVKEVGDRAFENCEELGKITLNEGLERIGSGFLSKTAVKEIIIPKTVTGMSSALSGAENLMKVTFENGIKTIPSSALNGVSNTVKEVIIPASVEDVGSYAFTGFSGTLMLMAEDSGASIYAIDNELAYEAKKNGISDSPDRYLARNKSFYTTSLSSSTTSGYVNLSLQYEFKDEAKKLISNKGMQLKIKIPSAVTLVPNTFKLNGKKTGVTPDENGYIYVPVENTKGNATFSLKISDVSYLMTYAQIEYQYQGENKCETIGIVNMAKKIFTLSVPDKTSEAKVDVLGFTEPGQSVQLYFEGNMVQTVKASNTGSYMATMNIPDPQEGSMYKIEAKTVSGEEESSAIAYTKYTKNSVRLTQCTMYYRNQSYDLLSLAGTRPVISWANGTIFTFKVAFSDNSNVGDVNIVSTKGGEVNKLRAVWNEKQKAYIAAGFSGYVPGNITVEYGKNLGVGFDGNQVSLGEPFDEKEIIGYESKVKLKDIPEFYYLKEQEEKVSKLPSGDYERMDYDGSLCYLSKEIEYRTKGDKTYACQEIFIKQEDDSYIRLRIGIGLKDNQSGKKAKAKITRDAKDDFKEIKSLIKLLSDVSEDTEDAEIYVMLEKTINTAMSAVKPSSAEYSQLQILKTKLEMVKLMNGSRKAYTKINKIIENASKYSNDPDTPLLPADKITEKMKESVDEMNKCARNVTNRHLREIMEELTKGGWFSDSLLEKVIDNLEKDAENTDMNFNARYSIDPSGYVYEAVTDNRLEGVKATIYYKDAENSTAVLWNAEEYDQSNPLYTDDLGYYAWDVPEGLWQVKFEKEGYETASSEWLPVPPPQLEVNKGMVSKEKPKIEKMVAYSDHIEIAFSKYMMPDTVAALKITDQEGKAVSYNLEYDKRSVDESGANFAREYNLILKDGKALEPGTACKVSANNSLKSYAGIEMDAHEYSSNVQKNIEIIAPDTVSVKMGETIEVPVKVANSSEKVQISAVSGFDEIASVNKVGKDSISILGNMYGSTKIIIKIEGIDIQKEIKVNVGTDSKVSAIEKKVILPQSVYTMSKGESIKIVPEIYPDSSAKGKWTLSGDHNIIFLDGDNFRADKVGEVTARYTLDGSEDVFAECKIIVISKAVKGDINGDGKINLVDLMMCLNHVSKKKLLEGTAFEAADIDGKNGVNLVDLMRILNYVSKKSSSL